MVLLSVLAVATYLLIQPKSTSAPMTVVSKDEASNLVIAQYPALAEYRTTSLPPSSIEGIETADGWQLAFIQRGSGVPGILNAHCFAVTHDKQITALGQYIRPGDAFAENVDFATCKPINEQSPRTTVLPYGDVVLSMGQLAKFKDISILPIGIAEDSRCPVDVQCIQAGTVRVKIEVVSGMRTSTSIVKLGSPFTTESEKITLTAVGPEKRSQTEVAMADYKLTFNVVPQSTPVVSIPAGKCYVGGCSSHICSEEPDAMSTCEFREEYACYKTAKCEKQATGKCGWTTTPALKACVTNS